MAGMSKDEARWKRDERQRKRDAGFILLQVWVLPKHRERVVNYVKRLNRAEESKK